MAYFLIAVSTKTNLDLCMRYALAGFTNSVNGVWAFSEVLEGDYISFLYGARVHNLYQVQHREAIENADELPPWDSITFRESGRTYYFPFRLRLKPVRALDEPVVRAEFAYVAENLLLRGGYRKTHFEADQTTLQNVSQMGTATSEEPEPLSTPDYRTFVPLFTRSRSQVENPRVFLFAEPILQSALRQHLLENCKLELFLDMLDNDSSSSSDRFEVLSEKALPEGHVDLLLKERVPIGRVTKIPLEVKLNQGQLRDVEQAWAYMQEFGDECPVSALIAAGFAKSAIRKAHSLGVKLFRYTLALDWSTPKTFEDIRNNLQLEMQAV